MSSTGQPIPVHFSLDNTFGALQIGTLVAVFLFGIITLQTHCYFRDFRDDKLQLKATVLLLWILELGHTVGICVEVYRTTIVYSGRPLEYGNFKGIGSATLLGGIITMIVQSFFSLRAWRLLPSPFNYIGAAGIIVSIVRCGFSSLLSYKAISATSVAQYESTASWLITMLLSIGAGIDVTIAAAMLYFFATKRKNALHHTAQVVDRLLGFTVRTGLLTSITAVAVLVCFQLSPRTYIWAGVYCFLAKLYSNSFLATLNDRQELRKSIMATSVVVNSQSSRFSRRRPSLSVVVDVKTETDPENLALQSPRAWEHAPPSADSYLDKKTVASFV